MTNVPMRRVVSLVLIFIVISAIFLVLDRRSLLDPIRDGLGEVLAPIASTFEGVVQPRVGGSDLEVAYATVVADRNRVVAENARLKAEVEELKALREQVRVEQLRPDITYVPARVTGQDPTGSQQFITINKGSADGLRQGMAAVSPDIFVGQITEVQEHQARVLLVTDPALAVGAMLYDARADGVVYGTRGSGGLLIMRHVDKDVVPSELEWVVTSDVAASETAQVPSNIPIGVVVGEPALNAQSDQLEIMVQPAADFENLMTVWIAVPNG
ncbi:MAG TPA: rod shape-determining protein MreC [Thermomicrobiales bacterium]|nr:rod shape-determining protein MreC [Thermomicrobiales bacterium]